MGLLKPRLGLIFFRRRLLCRSSGLRCSDASPCCPVSVYKNWLPLLHLLAELVVGFFPDPGETLCLIRPSVLDVLRRNRRLPLEHALPPYDEAAYLGFPDRQLDGPSPPDFSWHNWQNWLWLAAKLNAHDLSWLMATRCTGTHACAYVRMFYVKRSRCTWDTGSSLVLEYFKNAPHCRGLVTQTRGEKKQVCTCNKFGVCYIDDKTRDH